MGPQKIAVVGSGISGLSAAWLLSSTHRVVLYEKDARLGGHTNTASVSTPDGPVPVDTGFIVYNEANYPNFSALLDHFKVPTSPSHMGFAVSLDQGRLEYNGEALVGLFGQPSNLLSPRHWRLVGDLVRFFRTAERDIASAPAGLSIGDFLERCRYSRQFVEDHLLPVSAAIWSTPSRGMLDFPAKTFIAFFANHGLLKILGRPQWRTVRGGAQEYVSRLVSDSRMEARTGTGVAAIRRDAGGVELTDGQGHKDRFDEVILACHADQALRLLADPTAGERALLGAFRFNANRAVLHSDPRFLPRRRHLWCAWNYLREGPDAGLSVTYWMNRLQPLQTHQNLFVTLNPETDFAPGTVHAQTDYEHPLFNEQAIAAQARFSAIQGINRTWFAGAWLGHGFHEDGLQSGLEVAERIGFTDRPWAVPRYRDRIAHNWAQGEPSRWAAE